MRATSGEHFSILAAVGPQLQRRLDLVGGEVTRCQIEDVPIDAALERHGRVAKGGGEEIAQQRQGQSANFGR